MYALQTKRVPSWQTASAWDTILGRPDLARWREFGIPVSAHVPVAPAMAFNYATFEANSRLAVARLLEYKSKKFLVGPIPQHLASFLGVVVSPLGCVEKDGGADFRIIHDLSLFVNPCCDDPKLSLPSVEDVRRAITPGCWFWKGDLLDGYKQFFLEPAAWRWFGMKFDGEIYLDATLAFGWNGAPGFFSMFSYAIRNWQRSRGRGIFTYIDDFFGVEPSLSLASAGLKEWVDVLPQLGLADKLSKRCAPAQVMTFIGLEWDSIAMEVRLPEVKKQKLMSILSGFVGRRWATVREVQRLAGKLCFAAQVVRGGWTHIRRIWDTYKGSEHRPSTRLIRLGNGFQSDVAFWVKFLPVWNGISTLHRAADIRFGTDACKTGYGASWGNRWITGAWSESTRARKHSNWKELTTVLLAARQWGHEWRDCVVHVEMDNTAAVGIINRGYSPCREYMRIARKLFWLSIEHGFEIRASWIPGVLNEGPDWLSRWLLTPSCSYAGHGAPTAQFPFYRGEEGVYEENLRHRSEGVLQLSESL